MPEPSCLRWWNVWSRNQTWEVSIKVGRYWERHFMTDDDAHAHTLRKLKQGYLPHCCSCFGHLTSAHQITTPAAPIDHHGSAERRKRALVIGPLSPPLAAPCSSGIMFTSQTSSFQDSIDVEERDDFDSEEIAGYSQKIQLNCYYTIYLYQGTR